MEGGRRAPESGKLFVGFGQGAVEGPYDAILKADDQGLTIVGYEGGG